jgi:hypothetical protein
MHTMWRRIALTIVSMLILATKSFAWQNCGLLLRRQLPVVSATTLPHALPHPSSTKSRLYNNDMNQKVLGVSESAVSLYKPGDKIQVEVISFGPLGASVDVIGNGHADADLIPESSPPLAKGLIYQKEIAYFRQARQNVDVIRGEVLPAYVEKVRLELGGRLDISLRMFGAKAKAEDVAGLILERLRHDGTLLVGDKSTPGSIAREFPGVSKSSFKLAVGSLYRQGKVQPGPDSISLMNTSSNKKIYNETH